MTVRIYSWEEDILIDRSPPDLLDRLYFDGYEGERTVEFPDEYLSKIEEILIRKVYANG